MYHLQRFLDAQERVYEKALAEIKRGRKQSHWMWFIFPQMKGLGISTMAQHYGIENLAEATTYLQHPVLGKRLVEICTALLQLPTADAHAVFGSPDDIKLRSCVTLFAAVPQSTAIFKQVLDKFFAGLRDNKTVQLLQQKS